MSSAEQVLYSFITFFTFTTVVMDILFILKETASMIFHPGWIKLAFPGHHKLFHHSVR